MVAAGHGCKGFALARYKPNGSLDCSFGSGGTVQSEHLGGEFAGANALVIQPDGKLVVSGDDGFDDPAAKVIIARYNANGSLDRSFGSGGKVIHNLGRNAALAIQPDGKIVAAGAAATTSSCSLATTGTGRSTGASEQAAW